MEPQKLIHYIRQDEAMNALSLQYFVDIAKQYPYFQSVRMLYLKNLSEVRSLRFAQELRKHVVYISDRQRLFQWLDNGEFAWSQHLHKRKSTVLPADTSEKEDTFSLIDSFLQQTVEDPYPEQLEDLLPMGTHDSADYIQLLKDKPDVSGVATTNRQQQLIDSFIEKGEKERVLIPLEDLNVDLPKSNANTDSLIKEDAFLTESLAKIYIKQKKYSKALEIIKKLSLKYPEKNVYFADQIRFLEKIITNIKTE